MTRLHSQFNSFTILNFGEMTKNIRAGGRMAKAGGRMPDAFSAGHSRPYRLSVAKSGTGRGSGGPPRDRSDFFLIGITKSTIYLMIQDNLGSQSASTILRKTHLV